MKTTPRIICAFSHLVVAAVLLAMVASGCSPKGSSERAAANQYFESGAYDRAEIEYKNVIQAKGQDAHAIGRLGVIYLEQGRVRQSVAYLMRARELAPDNLEVRAKLGMLYVSSSKFKEAKEEAEYILTRQPEHPTAPSILVQASLSTPEEVAAVRERLSQLPAPHNQGAPVLTALGIAELRLRNLAAAEEYFVRAIAADPKLPEPHMALGTLYRAQKLTEKADQALKAGMDLASPRSGNALQYAQFKIQSGDSAAGRAILEELAKTAPDYLPPQALLAEMAATEKRYEDSAKLVATILTKEPAHPEASLLSARLKLVRGEPAKAAEELEKLLTLYPNWPQTLYFLGLAYSGTGEQLKAVDRLTQAIRISPMPEAVLALAAIQLRSGDYGAAVLGLKPLVEKYPTNVQARLMLSGAYRAQGNTADALALYKDSESKFPTNPQIPFQTGLLFLRQNNREQARQSFTQALERAPNFLPAWEQLINLDLAAKNYDAALERVDSELRRDAQSVIGHIWAGRIHAIKGDVARAETEFKKAISLNPQIPTASLDLARLYVASNQQQSALESLQTALKQDPSNQNAMLLMAMIHDQQKNHAAARDTYEKLLILNPKSSLALNNLAYLYSERFQDLDKAYDMAQSARALLPDEPHTADTFGWILYKKGQYARAVGMLEESAAALPNEPDVQYHLGMARYMTGLEQPAIDAFERALELNPKIDSAAEIQQRLIVLTLDRNAPAEASIAKLEKLIADSPKDPVALSRLGVLYEGSGAGDKAFSAYQRAIQANASSAAPWMGLARVYLSRNDTSNALEAAKTARKLAPGDESVAQSLGNIAHRAGDSTWAASLLQEAVRGRPDDPALLYETAQVLYSVGRLDDARETMSNAVRLFEQTAKSASGVQLGNGTKDADAARSFLEMVALSKDPASTNAEAKIRNALDSNPDDAPALMALGALNEYRSDFPAAQRAYEQVLARHPELVAAKRNYAILSSASTTFEPRAYDWGMQARLAYPSDAALSRALGILTYRKGDNDARAVTLLQQGTETYPKDAELAYYLGMVQLRMKESVKARESLEKAISLGLAANLAADARKRLEELK